MSMLNSLLVRFIFVTLCLRVITHMFPLSIFPIFAAILLQFALPAPFFAADTFLLPSRNRRSESSSYRRSAAVLGIIYA